jgi:hypothetical protein
MSSYENGYLGITSFDYTDVIGKISDYLLLLERYVVEVNRPCTLCNKLSSIAVYSKLILAQGSWAIYKFDTKYVVVFSSLPELFLVLDNQVPTVIINMLDMYYKDVTSNESLPVTTIKGGYFGNELAVYNDKYCACTIYDNITENYVYTPMTISDKKKYEYRRHLYIRSFTYESKRNCSC